MDCIGKYVIVRTQSAGVFAGTVETIEYHQYGVSVGLMNARRLWYWSGAATLSQLATDGTQKPKECKFPCPVDHVLLTNAIEIIIATDTARESIESVFIWKI